MFTLYSYLMCCRRHQGRRSPDRLPAPYRHITDTLRILTAISLIVVTTGSGPLHAEQGSLQLSAGAEYITGDYGGTQSIDQIYVPVTLRYSISRYSFRLTVPYIGVHGPSDTILSDGTVIPGTGALAAESGVGDVIAGVTYLDTFNTEAKSDFAIDLTAKIKFGTADVEKNLGSGEDDITLQAEIYKFLDTTNLFTIIGYKLRGDPPGTDLDNSLILMLGGNNRVTPDHRLGIDLYYQQAYLPGIDDQLEISADLGYRLSDTEYLGSYIVKGLSDASPDWGIGFYLTFEL